MAEASVKNEGKRSGRLDSLDAYRGAVVLLMASGGLGITQIAKAFPNSSLWQFAGHHTEHATWRGCTLWDLIQPAFMFMVGVALPWSLSKRREQGTPFAQLLCHAMLRAALLILLAVFLSSAWDSRTDWVFTNVLAQIGLGYPFLFLVGFASTRIAWSIALGILLVYWGIFAFTPLPPPDYPWTEVGFKDGGPFLQGFAGHWEKNANAAFYFDRWFLNLFPRSKPFQFNSGGYTTLNFIPSISTMIFGLLAGRALQNRKSTSTAAIRIALAGAVGILLGHLLDATPICPAVKRLWSPSFALLSSGWVAIGLALFVVVIDVLPGKAWAFPLIVTGLNPLSLYCMWQLSGGFIKKQTQIHLGADFFSSLGETWKPLVERSWILLVLWLVTWWMYRNKFFIRL